MNNNLRKLSREYLQARKKFRDATDKNSLLSGNDNIVGRIGEFIAVQFLEKEFKRKNITRNQNPVERGYDIIADQKKVSVKTITAENSSGRTTKIKDPWDEFVLVEIGENNQVLRIGYLVKKDFLTIYPNDQYPVAARSMFHEGHIIFQKGKIFQGKRVQNYL